MKMYDNEPNCAKMPVPRTGVTERVIGILEKTHSTKAHAWTIHDKLFGPEPCGENGNLRAEPICLEDFVDILETEVHELEKILLEILPRI